MQNNKTRNVNGFTLVELAVGLLIIGLLTAGALKGQAIVENARVAGLVSGLDAVKKAHISFVNTYGELPGDIDAPYVVPGCEEYHPNFCLGGNQDGAIGTVMTSEHINTWNSHEHAMYWKHLVLGGFYTGLDPTVDVRNQANLERGVTHPNLYRRTVLEVIHLTKSGCDPQWCQHEGPTYRFQPDFLNYSAAEGEGAIKPLYAQKVDRKLDDGDGNTGMVASEPPAGVCREG